MKKTTTVVSLNEVKGTLYVELNTLAYISIKIKKCHNSVFWEYVFADL